MVINNTVAGALAYLTSVCDGAASWDGSGFSGADATFGKDLAAKAGRYGLSEKQHACGLKLCHKYRRQLSEAGYDPAAIAADAYAPKAAAGAPQAAPGARTGYVKPTKPIDGYANKFAGRCGCGTRVEAGAGRCTKQDGRWVTYCGPCAEPTREADIAAHTEECRRALQAEPDTTRQPQAVVDAMAHVEEVRAALSAQAHHRARAGARWGYG